MDIQWPPGLPHGIKDGEPALKTNLVLKAGDLLNASVLAVDKGRDALLGFGRFKAYARLPLPVVTGQTIQIKVQQADQGLRMVMVPSGAGRPGPNVPDRFEPQMGAQPVHQGEAGPEKGNGNMAPTVPDKANLKTETGQPGSGLLQAKSNDRPPSQENAHRQPGAQPPDNVQGPPVKEGGNMASTVPEKANPIIGDRQPHNGNAQPVKDGVNMMPTTAGKTNLQIGLGQPDNGMLPSKYNGNPPPSVPASDNLPIRLFEPVSDRPFLGAHAHQLRSGESLAGRITGFSKDGLMLVDFGKFKAFTKIDIPVREGQILPLTVNKTDQGITFSVQPSSVRADANAPSHSPSALAASSVVPGLTGHSVEKGTMAQASFASAPPAGTAAVYQKAVPQSAVALDPPTAPEMIRLRDQIQQVFGGPNSSEHASRTPLPQTTQEALNHLQQLLRPVSTADDKTDLMASIKKFVENSGLYFEKRMEAVIRSVQDRSAPMPSSELALQPPIRELMVKDLKPNLLVLNKLLDFKSMDQDAADRHVLETMKRVVQRTLAHIEQQQLGATEKPVDPDMFQAFSHLLLLADGRREARLKVYYAKKGRGDDANKTPRVALLLEMDRLGTVRTDLWMVGKDLNITFFVQAEETKAEIKAVQDEIKTALKESFNTVAVNAVVNKKKIDQFDDEDVSRASQRILDLTI